MVEITSYQKQVNLTQLSDRIRERVPASWVVYPSRTQGLVPIAQGSLIDPIFRFIDWMCSPYQPVEVIISPRGPDDYLEQVHQILAHTYAVELRVGDGKQCVLYIATKLYSGGPGIVTPLHLVYQYSRLFVPPNVLNSESRSVYFN